MVKKRMLCCAGAVALLSVQAASAQDAQEQTVTTQTPTGVEVEIGLGSRIGGPQVSNYQTSNGVLALTNLGRAAPQLLTGLGFVFCDPSVTTTRSKFCSNAFSSRLGTFVSAQFGSGSNSVVSGYSLGMTVGLGRYLRGLVGFSLTPADEISPGFATAASQYVAKNPALFPGISPANLSSKAYAAFDGIQFTNTQPAAGSAATATIFYPGPVTTTHYRGGFLIGVSLPINIYNLIQGNKTGH
jgi:hypothetical protein